MERSFSRSRNFLLLRGGQFVGDFGGNCSSIALPVTLIFAMAATPAQMGALDAVGMAMIPLTATVAGLIADRMRRRTVLIAANAVRLIAIMLIPLMFFLSRPPLWLFFVVTAAVAIASSVFDMAYAAFVPQVAGQANGAAAAAKLAVGSSLAEVTGTGIAGVLVTTLGAPIVLLINATTFIFSTAAIAAIRVDDSLPIPTGNRRSVRADLCSGFAAILAHPLLRRVTFSDAVAHFGGGMAAAVATIYIYRDLHLAPATLGIAMALANAGAFAAWRAEALAERFGVHRTLAGAHLISAVGKAALPLLSGLFPLAALCASRLALTAAGPVFAVNDAGLRIAFVPDELLGRATATARTIVWTALPLGSLAGGFAGEHIGLYATMMIGATITAAAALLVYRPDYSGAIRAVPCLASTLP